MVFLLIRRISKITSLDEFYVSFYIMFLIKGMIHFQCTSSPNASILSQIENLTLCTLQFVLVSLRRSLFCDNESVLKRHDPLMSLVFGELKGITVIAKILLTLCLKCECQVTHSNSLARFSQPNGHSKKTTFSLVANAKQV